MKIIFIRFFTREKLSIMMFCNFRFQITLFSEGTRRTEEKLKASQEFAIKNGKKPLKYHLYPRTKGFAVVVHNLKDHCKDCLLLTKHGGSL